MPPSKIETPKTLDFLTRLGYYLIGLGFGIFAWIYLPIAKNEVKYEWHQRVESAKPVDSLAPVNTDFAIVIPKIQANAPIIKDVDPYNSRVYQRALAEGVAQAKGSGVPGGERNIFLFAHSSASFALATSYNSVFYLLNKLENGDRVYLYYQGQKHDYLVDSKKIVVPQAIEYLANHESHESLTLMTCWPPGTSLKRLVVTATPLQ